MKILFATADPFIPEFYSGPIRTLLELCRHLAAAGHEPWVLASWADPSNRSTVIRDLSYGFPLFRAADPQQCIAALTVTLGPDISVVTGSGIPALTGALLAVDAPVLVWLSDCERHGFSDQEIDPRVTFVASSSFVAERAAASLGISAEVVPPFIDKPMNVCADTRGEHVLFINPIRRKGFELVLQMACARPEIHFVFSQGWPLSPHWRRTAYLKAARSNNIEWRPPTVDRTQLYAGADLLLAPSICEEGFGRSVTEAQMQGIPVLASNRGYLESNVGPGGHVLSPDAPLALWLEFMDRMLEPGAAMDNMRDAAREHAHRVELEGKRVTDALLAALERHLVAAQKRRRRI